MKDTPMNTTNTSPDVIAVTGHIESIAGKHMTIKQYRFDVAAATDAPNGKLTTLQCVNISEKHAEVILRDVLGLGEGEAKALLLTAISRSLAGSGLQ